MKIVIDPQVFNNQKYGGISRYYTEILVALKQKKNINIEIPLLITKNIYFIESSLVNKYQKRNNFLLNLIIKAGISVRKKIKKINQKRTIKVLKKQDFDLFIPTYYDPYFLDHIGSKPFVLTVYDMIHELFPEGVLKDSKLVIDKLLLMEKASKIIAVSNNTKNDIIRIYPHLEKSKIEVIYHGNSIFINEKVKINLPLKYILFVGSRFEYKNFKFLVEAISKLLKNDLSLHLVCAGGGHFSKDEKTFLMNLNLNSQIIQIDFKENELGMIYKNAICFVFPSIYEGFGIPVLESMACGCPIVLANHSSFPEVAGKAGVYFELNNSDDLVNKINNLIQNDSIRYEYSLKGLEQVKFFNWDKAANECLDIYEKACLKH